MRVCSRKQPSKTHFSKVAGFRDSVRGGLGLGVRVGYERFGVDEGLDRKSGGPFSGFQAARIVKVA